MFFWVFSVIHRLCTTLPFFHAMTTLSLSLHSFLCFYNFIKTRKMKIYDTIKKKCVSVIIVPYAQHRCIFFYLCVCVARIKKRNRKIKQDKRIIKLTKTKNMKISTEKKSFSLHSFLSICVGLWLCLPMCKTNRERKQKNIILRYARHCICL